MTTARILIVEDEAILAGDLQDQLVEMGHTVVGVADTAASALRLAADAAPNLVFMDIRLKGERNGVGAATDIRHRFDIPVVFLTAHSDQDTLDRAKAAEPYGYVHKPCESRDLQTAIEMAVYKHAADRRVRESERRHRITLQCIGDGVIVADDDERVVLLNPVAERLTGWTQQEAVGQPIGRVFSLARPPAAGPPVHPFLNLHAHALEGEVTLTTRGGGAVQVEHIATRITEPSAPPTAGMVVAFRDVTERRKYERELLHTQKLESLGVLAGGIAHDFNNLLTGILGYASMARLELEGGNGDGGAAVSHIQQIEKGALRAADLCKQMLAYAGKGQVAAVPTDLNRLVEEMTALLSLSLSKKAVLRFNLAAGLPAVQCDPTQLRQVVMNLITNASDAVGDRSGLITVSSGVIDADEHYLSDIGEYRLPPKRYVYLEVSDTGCGMSDEVKARIFEPFYTTKFTGRGLGLSAVVGIVRSHHGAIKVYSQVGKGTTFKVLLPAAEAAAALDTQRPSDRRAFGRGRRVLVVEDEEDIRVLVRKVLASAGFTVDVAADGQAGVEAFRHDPQGYALVLMDLTMPRLDGAELYRELRQACPDVTAVLMSGFSEGDATAGFEGKGLAGFLRKPFSVNDLLAAVHTAVGP